MCDFILIGVIDCTLKENYVICYVVFFISIKLM